MRVYLSGPITGTDDYMERFAAAEEELTKKGYSVVNPAKVNAQLPKDTTWNQYMYISLALLGTCKRMYMLPGWQQSKGVKAEIQYAWKNGIEVIL